MSTPDEAIGQDPTPTNLMPTLSSLADWRVGATEGGQCEVRIVLRDPAEARAWAQWLLSVNERQD